MWKYQKTTMSDRKKIIITIITLIFGIPMYVSLGPIKVALFFAFALGLFWMWKYLSNINFKIKSLVTAFTLIIISLIFGINQTSSEPINKIANSTSLKTATKNITYNSSENDLNHIFLEENTTKVANTTLKPKNTTIEIIRNTTLETKNTTVEVIINTTLEPENTTVEVVNTTLEPENTTVEVVNTTLEPENTTIVEVVNIPIEPENVVANVADTPPIEPPQTVNEQIVYWVPNGKSYHFTTGCPTLSRSKTILNGPFSTCPKSDPCDKCAY